jgi:hypothetical protein
MIARQRPRQTRGKDEAHDSAGLRQRKRDLHVFEIAERCHEKETEQRGVMCEHRNEDPGIRSQIARVESRPCLVHLRQVQHVHHDAEVEQADERQPREQLHEKVSNRE